MPLPLDLEAEASSHVAAPSKTAQARGSSESASSCSGSSAALPTTCDRDPTDWSGDRLLASLGLLDDAAPLFGSRSNVPRAGVLLAIPALVQSGVFECAQQIYGSLGPAFYGLRTSLLTLLLMALWRIKRPEGLKELSPQDLGRVLGLDRAPEVKTLRRKLTRLSAVGRAAQLGQALARNRLALRGENFGFLYVDGHVRVYHGQRRLPKTHVARMRLAMRATTDYWTNDAVGDPLFVVTTPANAGLVKMLPNFLKEVRGLVGKRRVTVVFDRGGFSPKLFKQILAEGFDLLTYRKGRCLPIPRKHFQPSRTRLEGKATNYLLGDQEVRLLEGKLRLRQVTRLGEDGHQTPILTSRRDLPPAQVASRMFAHWRQENFFKYLREEYALDALADYSEAPDNPTREIPNPAWKAADAKLRQAYAHLESLEAEYGLEAFKNIETQRRTMRGFKIAQRRLGENISRAMQRVVMLEKKRVGLPKRIPLQDVPGEAIVKLAPERKHLTNLLKIVAYQAESALLRAIAPHYRRADDEGRTLIQSALASPADIQVTETQLRVTLAPLSSPHRTRALAVLGKELNQSATLFPGSSLRLHFAVQDPS
jgi:Transposase protein